MNLKLKRAAKLLFFCSTNTTFRRLMSPFGGLLILLVLLILLIFQFLCVSCKVINNFCNTQENLRQRWIIVYFRIRWVLLIRFVRFSIYLWVQSISFWGSDAGIVTDKTDSMRQRETKRWQNGPNEQREQKPSSLGLCRVASEEDEIKLTNSKSFFGGN